MQILSTRNAYGLIIVAAMLLSLLWVMLDNQASSHSPGLMAPFRRHVWCNTIIQLSDENDKEGRMLIVNHYPGKQLSRVLEDYGFQVQAIPPLLDADKKTQCFHSWREAAISDVRFGQMIKEYAGVIAQWEEATFREAIITMTFQENGEDKLRSALFRQAQQQQREATTP